MSVDDDMDASRQLIELSLLLDAGVPTVDHVRSHHVAAMAEAYDVTPPRTATRSRSRGSRGRMRTWVFVAVVAIATLTTCSALAATGALPQRVQHVVARAADSVGIEIPQGRSHGSPRQATNPVAHARQNGHRADTTRNAKRVAPHAVEPHAAATAVRPKQARRPAGTAGSGAAHPTRSSRPTSIVRATPAAPGGGRMPGEAWRHASREHSAPASTKRDDVSGTPKPGATHQARPALREPVAPHGVVDERRSGQTPVGTGPRA